MSAVYDNWERLVSATLRREELRLTALRTPSDLSLVSASSSSSFNFSSNYDQLSSLNLSSSLVGDSFTYNQILKATDFLNDSNLIKHGQSGDLYFGVLESGIEVAIKKFNASSLDKEFLLMSEMKICGMVHHSRLIPLLGHCLENADEKFMVYKYMPNKDLSRFLNGKINDDRGSASFDWIKRVKIATGAVEGLCYLHHECYPPLVHRDVQASSILLDGEFEVRLGSLSGVCIEEKDHNQNRISRFLRLTKGFEESNSGVSSATCAYDIYCFGKVLLELVTGKLGISAFSDSTVNDWIASTLHYIVPNDKKLIVNIIDSSLILDEHLLMEVWAVAFIAKACLSPKPSKRPQMAEILKALERATLERLTGRELLPTAHASSIATGIKQVPEEIKTIDSSTASPNYAFSAASGSVKVYPNGEILAHPALRIFTYWALKDATRNFGNERLLREDVHGRVYRGLLNENSMSKNSSQSVVAVKRINVRSAQGFQHWKYEVELLGRLSHPNILKLLGYCCWEDKEQLLVYEFMQVDSLKNQLFGRSSAIQPLTWDRRFKILIGAARGLAFLHASETQYFFQQRKKRGSFYECFDCSKILIDSDCNAKLTDFSIGSVAEMYLPRSTDDVHPLKYSKGVYAYAPRDKRAGKLQLKSDVYGFGVVLLQVLTGTEGVSLASFTNVEPLKFVENKMDPWLTGKFPANAAIKMVALAQLCLRVQYEYEFRPSMKQVVKVLERVEKIK